MNIGVIGCSKFAARAMLPALLKIDDLNLKFVASRNFKKAQDFADQFKCQALSNYDELITNSSIDAVYIPLPTKIQYEWVKKALLNGKHVLVEKTFIGDFSQVKELIDIAKEKSLLILENFLFLRHKQSTFIKDCLNKELIGKINLIKSSFCFPHLEKDNFRYQKTLGGGALLDAGTYIIKCLNHYIHLKSIKNVNSSFLKEKEIDITGNLTATLNDNIFMQGFYSFNSFYQCSLEIIGTSGKIEATRIFTAPPDYSAKLILSNKENSQTFYFKDNHYKNQWLHFKKLISDKKSYEEQYEELSKQSELLKLFLGNPENA